MEWLTDRTQMKQCDKNTIEYFGIPSMVLMERAALGVIEQAGRYGADFSRCLVVCGLGNNGGDGLAVARLLFRKGCLVDVVIDWEEEKASPETKQQYETVLRYQLPIYREIPKKEYTLVVDALFGIGLTRELEGKNRRLVEEMNACLGMKVAVDIPSGIRADDGQMLGAAFLADLTVTFGFRKIGMILFPGCSYANQVVVQDIGIDRHSWLGGKPSVLSFEERDLALLPARKPRTNKGSYGKVLVAAGKKNMAGAAYLSAKSAAVTGCGLVKLFTVEENRTILQSLIPEAVLETYTEAESRDGRMISRLEAAVQWADVIVIGPGLGLMQDAEQSLMCVMEKAKVPVIIDADGLNLLAQNPRLRALLKNMNCAVLTPHLGEMSRLTGQPVDEIQKGILTAAKKFATAYGVICILKDARTICALPDTTAYMNQTGNNGMATAGAGDVLTGVLAGLMAQGMKPEEAAPLGVYVHGLAGDEMVKETGAYGLLAGDIITGLKRTMRKELEHE